MKPYKELILITFLLFVIIGLKYLNMIADNDLLAFILVPTKTLVEFFTGTMSIYSLSQGHFFEALNITIDKSCSGLNFWVMSWTMAAFMTIRFFKDIRKIALSLLVITGLSYIFTLFANASRIVGAIYLEDFLHQTIGADTAFIHKTQGAMTYLFCLVCFYGFLNFLLLKFFQPHLDIPNN